MVFPGKRVIAAVLVFICLIGNAALSLDQADFNAAKKRAEEFVDTHTVDVTDLYLSLDEMVQLKSLYPGLEWRWVLSIYDRTISWEDEYCDLGGYIVKDYGELADFLSVFSRIKALDMYKTKITDAEIGFLTSKCPDVLFGWTILIGNFYTVRTDATAFSTLYTGKEPQLSNKDFDVIRYCTKLLALDLGHHFIDDLSFLKDLTNLKILILAKNKLTDISLLSGLVNLEYLELFCNEITDISPLAGMTKLVYLELSVNNIKDYTPLYGLPNLERVNLTRSGEKLNKAEIRKGLPHCRIDFITNPTQGDWRKTPRYLWVKRIFMAGVFKEWPAKKK